MFKKNTLFVLGAGASAEFGLPDGIELARRIGAKMDVRFEHGSKPIGTGDHRLYESLQNGIARPQSNQLFGAFSRIKNGIVMSNSIDDFLDLHQSDELMRLVGKSAIVQCIVEAERDSLLMAADGDEQFDSQKIENTWLLKLVRMLGAKASSDRFFDNVAFISFNYDRTLEHFLQQAIQNLYALDEQQSRVLMGKAQIFHPYGTLAPLAGQSQSLGYGGFRGLSVASPNFARNIRTYTEEVTEKTELDKMRGAVGKAEQIVFLGFGFHVQNIELIRGDFTLKPIFATAFGASAPNVDIIKDRIGTLFAPTLRTGNWQRYLNISGNKAGDFMDEFRLPLLS